MTELQTVYLLAAAVVVLVATVVVVTAISIPSRVKEISHFSKLSRPAL